MTVLPGPWRYPAASPTGAGPVDAESTPRYRRQWCRSSSPRQPKLRSSSRARGRVNRSRYVKRIGWKAPPGRRRGPPGVCRRTPGGGAQAASGSARYWRQVAGIVGEASWMKMWAPGVRGFTRGCMLIWCGSRSPLRRLHGAQEATMFSQSDAAALRARDHVVDRERGARAAVLALPAVAREDRAAGDLAPVRVARDAHVGDEPDHDRPRERAGAQCRSPAPVLEHLGLRLEQQDRGAPDRAHVDRLERGVEDQHATTSSNGRSRRKPVRAAGDREAARTPLVALLRWSPWPGEV